MFERDKLKYASRRGRNLSGSHWRGVAVRAPFFCLSSHVHSGSSENVSGELYNQGFVGPFAVFVPCSTFSLWNKATEALKQVRFIPLSSVYDKLLWHHGTATGQCHRITAAERIPSVFLSLCSHLNRVPFHWENKIQLLSSEKSHILDWIHKS